MTLPNLWGLFDLHGNLLEPCEDRYGMYRMKLGLLRTMRDPLQPKRSNQVVLRGRVIRSNATRSSSRDKVDVWDAVWPEIVGLRVARNAPAGPADPPPFDDPAREEKISRVMRWNSESDVSPHLAERAAWFRAI